MRTYEDLLAVVREDLAHDLHILVAIVERNAREAGLLLVLAEGGATGDLAALWREVHFDPVVERARIRINEDLASLTLLTPTYTGDLLENYMNSTRSHLRDPLKDGGNQDHC